MFAHTFQPCLILIQFVMKDNATPPKQSARQSSYPVFMSLWKKYRLLYEITIECTKIYPAKTDETFVVNALLKVNDLGYDIAGDFENPRLEEEVVPRIKKSADKLKRLWNDANKRGIAPLTETGIIVHIIKEIKHETKQLKSYAMS